MTDFLGRLAARAVGHASTAQPRLPARFEDPLDGGGNEGLEVIETEAVVSQAGGARAALDAGSKRPNGDIPRQDPGAAQRSSTAPESRPRRHEAAGRSEPIAPAAPTSVVDTDPRAASPLASSPTDAEPVLEATHTDASPLVMASVVPVPAATDVFVTGRPDELGHSIGLAAPEPPIVRVHIGRLEIRASLPEPQPARPARTRESATKSVSLAEYLRGSR